MGPGRRPLSYLEIISREPSMFRIISKPSVIELVYFCATYMRGHPLFFHYNVGGVMYSSISNDSTAYSAPHPLHVYVTLALSTHDVPLGGDEQV